MAVDPVLCSAADSVLLVIDIQPRLAEAMPEEESKSMLDNTAMLLQAAAQLDIPALATEQYPKGLGTTSLELVGLLPQGTTPLPKTGFSCFCAEGFEAAIKNTRRSQIIIAGQETHVCVLQTAFDFLLQGYQVFVVEDAVCSRNPEHKIYALERMRQAGAVVTCGESVLFEWLGDASHPKFKSLAQLIR